jgi:hypothetical protein
MTAEVSLKISRKSNGKLVNEKLCGTIKHCFTMNNFPFLSNGTVLTESSSSYQKKIKLKAPS